MNNFKTEHDFQNYCRKELSKMGFITFHFEKVVGRVNSGTHVDSGVPKGWPDLQIMKDGKTYYIELKIRNNGPQDDQIRVLTALNKQGFVTGVAWTWEHVLAIISGERNGVYEKNVK